MLDMGGNGTAEPFVPDPVAGTGQGRAESPGDLVLTLGAGFEKLQALFDAVRYALIVTGLEVKAVELPEAAPVAAVERGVTLVHEGAGDTLTIQIRQHQQDLIGQLPCHVEEKGVVEGGDAPLLLKGLVVESGEIMPVGFAGGVAVQTTQYNTRVHHPTPLLTDVLTLLGGQLGEKVIETLVVLIVPVELAVVPGQQLLLLHEPVFLLQRKQTVEAAGANLFSQLQSPFQE